MDRFIQVHEQDNVAVALTDLNLGEVIFHKDTQIVLKSQIARGHKFALIDLEYHQDVLKYGYPIGHTLKKIQQGELLNENNLKTNLSAIVNYKYSYQLNKLNQDLMERKVNLYRRKNGQVGIRNELWIIPTVGCVNAIARNLKAQFLNQIKFSQPGSDNQDNFDGVHVFSHQFGCSQLGDDHLQTRVLLQNLAKHPNAGGVLVLGLGCENNQIKAFEETLGEYDKDRVQFMVCQQHDDEIQVGLAHLHTLYSNMQYDRREVGKIREVKFGLECGGSDGLSGITANPLLGQFSDYVISHGGTSVLTEVPEMFGAEHLLMQRCISQDVFDKTVTLINNFKQYFIDNQQPIYENPSPGNKAGGISTLEEKSLGCTQKAGQSAVMDVLEYGERLKTPGLNLLSAPGNDAIATSALASAHCHLVLFTTGRGTPYGGPVPTVKIATNSDLAQRKPHWIDFNAGVLVEGKSMKDTLNSFIDEIVAIINGKFTKNEFNDFREIAVFKKGVTL